jgi:hypothetical protein
MLDKPKLDLWNKLLLWFWILEIVYQCQVQSPIFVLSKYLRYYLINLVLGQGNIKVKIVVYKVGLFKTSRDALKTGCEDTVVVGVGDLK